MDKEDIRTLRTARTLAQWSWIGLLIPVIGWILASISLSMLKDLPEHPKVKRIRRNALKAVWSSIMLLVVVAGLAAAIVYMQYQDAEMATIQSADAQRKEERHQQIEQTAKETLEESNRMLMTMCLNNVDSWYDANSQGIHTYDYWDSLNASKQTQIQECQTRYQ